jgi:hypothetical protein
MPEVTLLGPGGAREETLAYRYGGGKSAKVDRLSIVNTFGTAILEARPGKRIRIFWVYVMPDPKKTDIHPLFQLQWKFGPGGDRPIYTANYISHWEVFESHPDEWLYMAVGGSPFDGTSIGECWLNIHYEYFDA